VATGGTTHTALRDAGAAVVLSSLLDFPSWLEAWVTSHSAVPNDGD
jgi:hypothetical protein